MKQIFIILLVIVSIVYAITTSEFQEGLNVINPLPAIPSPGMNTMDPETDIKPKTQKLIPRIPALTYLQHVSSSIETFFEREFETFFNKENPCIVLPLERARADYAVLKKEISSTEKNPNFKGNVTESQLNEIEENIKYLRRMVRRNDTIDPPSRIFDELCA